ncbi:tape measure protein [Sphingobacterium mizutaii]|uniref:tape measure protein n=1 Tax=Sphingobacterium mizutaii TaxID=1010 RepID=UPI0016257A9B|nr:tape measure protein [Sphingobacterium mizutaii]
MSFVAEIQANIDNFQRNLDRAQARMDIFASTIGKRIAEVGQTFQNVGGKLSILTAAITALGVSSIKTFGDIQSLKMGLEAIMGSAEEAEKEFTKLLEVAKLPGLGLKEAAKGSVALQSAGFSADEARRSLMAFGNALATVGKGAPELDLVNLALTQLQNKASGFGQDLRQLTEQLPQLRGAMTEAFGTADSEEIAKLGYTGSQVVKMLTDEFEKLPKVTGGIKNAFENVSDATTIALSKIGEAINKNFDVEGKLSRIGDLLTRLSERFSQLDAPTQKMIITIAGIVAAIGPLLLALGTIMQLAPLVGTAFATMTGPIGISVVAIGAAVALIIKYWDEIKAYFTSGGGSKIWENISSGAQKLWKNLVDIFNSVRSFVTAIWDKIGSNVMTIIGNSFETVFAIVSSVIGQIIGVLTVFTSLIKGDFSGAFEAAKNVVKAIFNAIRTIVVNVISNVSNAIAGFLKLIGADSLGNSLEGWAKGLKPVKEQTEQVAVKVEEVAAKVENHTKKVVENTDALDKNKKKQVDYRKELDNTLASWGIYEAQVKVLNTTYQELDKTAKAAKATQEEFQTIMSRQWADKALLNFEKLGDNAFNGSNISKLSNGLNLPIELNPVLNNGKFEKVVSNLKSMAFELAKSFNEGFNEIINTSIADSIAEIAASIGGALASGDNLLKSVGSAMLGTLGGVLTELGKMAIQTGIGIKAIQLALKSLNPYVAIAAGVALVALGSAFKSGASSLANGGAGNANSSAYTGSSQSIQNAFPRGSYYNNDKQVVDLKIKGNNLVGSLNINQNRNNRLG